MDDQEQHKRYDELAKKLLDGTISETERRAYLDWLNREEEPLNIPNDFAGNRQELKQRIFNELQSAIAQESSAYDGAVPSQRKWYRYTAAAVIFLMIAGAATYFLSNKQSAPKTVAVINQPAVNDVSPGRTGAVLTLANGQQLLLDSLGNGVIATQGKTNIQIQNGQLVYDVGKPGGELLYNTMSTPKGRQFQLLLPDGSKVWLNAASSITYPATFTGKERVVKVSGEVYFEVATLQLTAGQKMPFIVQTATQEVEVLGTHFNINSYNDEPGVRTTLLEGKVKVTSSVANQSKILNPGEQAVLTNDSKLKIHDNVDLDEVMAWKNGRFEFNGNTIQSVMRQLSRWYDVDIVYEGDLPEANFVGAIARQENLSKVLKMLELTNVMRFQIREKTSDGKSAQLIVRRK